MPTLTPTIHYDGPVTIAVGPSRTSKQWQNRELLWSKLVQRLAIPERTQETQAEYQNMRKQRRDEIKDVGGFVGGALKGGRRKADAIIQRRLITLDLDSIPKGEDPWTIVSLIIGCAAVMYSTHSHTPEKPRLRIVIPLSRNVTPDEYAAISRRIAADIGIDMCDDTTYEPHRLMYWPSLPYDAEYKYEVSDGPWLDADEQLQRYTDWRDPAQWPTSSRRAEAMKRVAKKQGNPLEKEGIVGAFCRAYSVEDAIETFLPEVYRKCDDNRYTFLGGSTTGGLVIYEDGLFTYSHHGTDPTSGLLCNAFDLVRIHLYGELDDNAPAGTIAKKLPSFTAMYEMALELPEVQQDLAESRYKAVIASLDMDEDVDDTEWLRELTVTDKGKIESTIDNVCIILRHDLELKDTYYYDEFKDRMTVCGDLPWQALASRVSDGWRDSDDAGLRGYIEKKYHIDSANKVSDAIAIVMLERSRHPVREYLQSLVWDGTKRVDTLFVDYLGAEDTEYTRTVTRKALIGAVARIMAPGCKHDHMLVLIGPQGCRKSTTLSKLGKSWFSDSLYTVNGKEAYEQLQGYWLIEMAEMAAISSRKTDLEQIKQFISKQSDSYRAAYARRTQERPRQCAFFGTTNDDEFLRDPTGGRRFWPVTVTGAEPEIADALTEEVIDQVWAEVMVRYSAGEVWWLDDKKIEEEARKIQAEHTEQNEKRGLIEKFLNALLPEDWDSWDLGKRQDFWADGFEDEGKGTEQRVKVCALEVWQELFNGDTKSYSQQQAREINNILRQLPGWRRSTSVDCGEPYGRQRGFIRERNPQGEF